VKYALIGILELGADGHARRWWLISRGSRLTEGWRRVGLVLLDREEEEVGGLGGNVDGEEKEE